MLVIKIELWPQGDEAQSKELGRMQIVNIGGTPELGDYAVAAALEASPEVYCAKLEAVPRGEQWLWRLVREALEALKDITG